MKKLINEKMRSVSK